MFDKIDSQLERRACQVFRSLDDLDFDRTDGDVDHYWWFGSMTVDADTSFGQAFPELVGYWLYLQNGDGIGSVFRYSDPTERDEEYDKHEERYGEII